jgi:hypothetical protein
LLGAYKAEASPMRWVEGEHDRELDYYDPAVLTAKADASANAVLPEDEETAAERGRRDLEREVIARVLRRLDAGGGLLKRKVRWVRKYYALQEGCAVDVRKGEGAVVCGCVREEWLSRAVVIVQGEKVVRVFPEARKKKLWPMGLGNSRRPVVEMVVPELDAPELYLRRLGMNVAVLLKRLRSIDGELRSGAAIARAAGVTRANVSARQIKMEAEEEEEIRLAAKGGGRRTEDRGRKEAGINHTNQQKAAL